MLVDRQYDVVVGRRGNEVSRHQTSRVSARPHISLQAQDHHRDIQPSYDAQCYDRDSRSMAHFLSAHAFDVIWAL